MSVYEIGVCLCRLVSTLSHRELTLVPDDRVTVRQRLAAATPSASRREG